MTRTEQLTRRRFLGVTAATTGGGLLANLTGWGAATAAAAPTASGETEHFSYRLQPRGLYIDSQNDRVAFGYANGRILLSEDNAHTWPHSLAFPDAQRITFSSILRNGNVLFATGSLACEERRGLAALGPEIGMGGSRRRAVYQAQGESRWSQKLGACCALTKSVASGRPR